MSDFILLAAMVVIGVASGYSFLALNSNVRYSSSKLLRVLYCMSSWIFVLSCVAGVAIVFGIAAKVFATILAVGNTWLTGAACLGLLSLAILLQPVYKIISNIIKSTIAEIKEERRIP